LRAVIRRYLNFPEKFAAKKKETAAAAVRRKALCRKANLKDKQLSLFLINIEMWE
jgi:hypothetical protein